MKAKYKDLYPYCDKSSCKYWTKCTLALTEQTKRKLKAEPEVQEHRACFREMENEG